MSLIGAGVGIGSQVISHRDKIGQVAGGVTDVFGGVKSLFGGGGGNDDLTARSIPPRVPRSIDRSAGMAGKVYKHEGLSGRSMTLYPGFYDVQALERAGLHDEITSIQVRSGYTVHLYHGYENGPAGRHKIIVGPERLDLSRQWSDTISAIAVEKPRSSGGSSGGFGNGSTGGSGGGGSTGGSGSTGSGGSSTGSGQQAGIMSNPAMIVLAAIAAFLIFNQS